MKKTAKNNLHSDEAFWQFAGFLTKTSKLSKRFIVHQKLTKNNSKNNKQTPKTNAIHHKQLVFWGVFSFDTILKESRHKCHHWSDDEWDQHEWNQWLNKKLSVCKSVGSIGCFTVSNELRTMYGLHWLTALCSPPCLWAGVFANCSNTRSWQSWDFVYWWQFIFFYVIFWG